MIPLNWYLVVAAALFCIGLFGVLTRRSAIGILLGLEFMLNAVNINLLAFWRAGAGESMSGAVFTVVVFAVAAAEVAVGLAIIISVYRSRRTIVAADLNDLKE
jgi:NADH-quinone oxidoreductase subunit K